MLSRRSMLSGLAAGAALPSVGWADVGNPAYLAAARNPDGRFALYGIAAGGGLVFDIPLPGRGHAAAAHPDRAEAVAFARRPGTFALVLDCRSGAVRHRLTAPAGHHFYGHGTYLNDGTTLATTENHIETGMGRLGLWDVAAGYRRIGDVATGGIGPHDMQRLPGTDVLAVANGGIRTHPDRGREKLNLETMKPSLTYISDGEIMDEMRLEPDLHHASIRHLSVRQDGQVAFGMQWNGPEGFDGALVGLHHLHGGAPQMLAGNLAEQMQLEGYIGSVSFSGDETLIAATSPRGNCAQVYRLDPLGLEYVYRRRDVCGVAPSRVGFTFTDGGGGVITDQTAQLHTLAWDNHLVRIG